MFHMSRRFARVVAALGIVSLGCGLPAFGQAADGSDEGASPVRFGLFIGIDEYPHLPPAAQLKGCVRDAQTLQGLFESQFGFAESTLLINDQATREGIGKAISHLVESVRKARETTDRPLSVVLTYAGHGSQVRDQRGEGADEADRLDETWVTHDSSDGERDIRDDEIAAAFRKLAELDAQIVFISDSCHSGTMYRGDATHAVREVIRDEPGPGPSESLFPDWSVPEAGRARGGADDTAAGVIDAPPSKGFVAYTACRDAQQARECLDDDRQPCGRLSYVLRRVLPTMGPYSTYSEVFQRVAMEFDSLWHDYSQTPQFAASAAKTNERFLEGGFPPLHASIVPDSQRGNTIELTMGSIHGVSEGATFDFYPTISDLTELKNRLARATVVSVQPFRCRVESAELADIPENARARLDRVRLEDFFVYIDASADEPLQEAVGELERDQQLQRAETPADASVAVMRDPVSREIGIYAAAAIPDSELPQSRQPEPLQRVAGQTAQVSAEFLRQALLYRARIHRILTLEYNEDRISTRVIRKVRDDRGALIDAEAENGPGGFPQLAPGDKFTIRITNDTGAPLFVTVLYCGLDGTVDHVYPNPEWDDPVEALRPGDSVELGEHTPFIAEIEPSERELVERDGFVRTRLKIIASSDHIDFHPIVMAPVQAGTRGADLNIGTTRGEQPELQKFMADILHGGPLTRSSPGRAGMPTTWATGMVVYDVVPE